MSLLAPSSGRSRTSPASNGGPDGDTAKRSGSEDGELSRDEIFAALSNRRRRYVIRYLLRRDTPVELRELSRRLAASENDVPVEAISHKQRKRAYIALRQNHLPKLKEMRIVDYDQSMNRIVLQDRADVLETHLDPGRDVDIPWINVDIGLTVVGSLLLVLLWFDPHGFGRLSTSVYATLIVVALFLTTAVKYYLARSTRSASESAS